MIHASAQNFTVLLSFQQNISVKLSLIILWQHFFWNRSWALELIKERDRNANYAKKWRKKPPLELLFCFAANLFFPLLADIGEFHLHLLIIRLFIICKWQVQEDFSIISASFRISLLTLLHEKNVAFTLISFAVLKWDDCLSVQVLFQLHLVLT